MTQACPALARAWQIVCDVTSCRAKCVSNTLEAFLKVHQGPSRWLHAATAYWSASLLCEEQGRTCDFALLCRQRSRVLACIQQSPVSVRSPSCSAVFAHERCHRGCHPCSKVVQLCTAGQVLNGALTCAEVAIVQVDNGTSIASVALP